MKQWWRSLLLFGVLCALPVAAHALPAYEYQLFKNSENFGIVVFPPAGENTDLARFITGLGFAKVDTGNAVFRWDRKRENGSYMMSEATQQKHQIELFVIIQMLSAEDMMVGISHPRWGLTLPQDTYQMDAIKENLPKTLEIFRQGAKAPEPIAYAPPILFFPSRLNLL